MLRRGNVSETGQVDDKTEPVADKIEQNSIVTDSNAAISLQFTTTGPTPITSWQFRNADDTANAVFAGITFDTSSGLMSGTFTAADINQKRQLRVKAMNGISVIDDRTFDFSPSVWDATTGIRLQHPLPGSVLTSRFGPRRPPATGASSSHGGVDFAYPGGITKDVFCAADGEVILTKTNGQGYGMYVMIKHLNGAGQHLITTLYAHLASIYVKQGQKVVGGQAVGREGNTGISSGAHLHFEVRLPNNTRVDPMPFLQGPVSLANIVNADNTPNPSGGTTTVTSTGAATASMVAARSSCAAFGSSYPGTAPPVTPVSPGPPGPGQPVLPPSPTPDDYFEQAWYLTMLSEVNELWNTTVDRSPNNPDVANGLIETSAQRQRVGFVNHPRDPGGTTKFGIAQRYNPKIKIEEATYEQARTTGYNNYWLGSPNCASIAVTSPRIAIMLFDMKYLMGSGTVNRILTQTGVTGTETGAAEQAALTALHEARLQYLKTRPTWGTFGRGWTARAIKVRNFCQTL
jgi:murein DD-endopeptidase MepM/ murein hydrolase activator NlpD